MKYDQFRSVLNLFLSFEWTFKILCIGVRISVRFVVTADVVFVMASLDVKVKRIYLF